MSHIDPAIWTLDAALLDKEGMRDVQLVLFYDHRNIFRMYRSSDRG
jgi:hypothetical protein